eukprot:scaffold73874_cov42-Phaeocystis_antarctica.AAC.1
MLRLVALLGRGPARVELGIVLGAAQRVAQRVVRVLHALEAAHGLLARVLVGVQQQRLLRVRVRARARVRVRVRVRVRLPLSSSGEAARYELSAS